MIIEAGASLMGGSRQREVLPDSKETREVEKMSGLQEMAPLPEFLESNREELKEFSTLCLEYQEKFHAVQAIKSDETLKLEHERSRIHTALWDSWFDIRNGRSSRSASLLDQIKNILGTQDQNNEDRLRILNQRLKPFDKAVGDLHSVETRLNKAGSSMFEDPVEVALLWGLFGWQQKIMKRVSE